MYKEDYISWAQCLILNPSAPLKLLDRNEFHTRPTKFDSSDGHKTYTPNPHNNFCVYLEQICSKYPKWVINLETDA